MRLKGLTSRWGHHILSRFLSVADSPFQLFHSVEFVVWGGYTDRRLRQVRSVWSIRSVSSVWLKVINQMNQTDQMSKTGCSTFPVTDSMFERSITPLIIVALLLGTVLALRSLDPPSATPVPASSVPVLTPDRVPLVTGDEPIAEIFTKAGCAVCHTVPGISGADGRVGPPLLLGATGPARLADPAYRGHAKTVREYVIESVLEPGLFVVPGYPSSTMPTWYGAKLSALALEKIASYLEQQGDTTAQ